MKHIDPAKAARVWQRVQASLKQSPAPAAPTLPPLPVYTTPPNAWRVPASQPKPLGCKTRCVQSHSGLPWPWLLALILLLPHKNS